MTISSISPQMTFASRAAAATGMEYAVAATRQAFDSMQAEGQMLVQLIEQAAGVGQNINTSA